MITDNYTFLQNKPWLEKLDFPNSRGTGRTCKMIAAIANAFFNLQNNEYMLVSAPYETEVNRIRFWLGNVIEYISYEAYTLNFNKIIFGTPEFILKSDLLRGRIIREENIFIDHSIFEYVHYPLYEYLIEFLEKIKLCINPK